MNYIALIDDDPRGPATASDLFKLEAHDIITDTTYVREETNETWFTWQELKARLNAVGGPNSVSPVQQREALRARTAYPIARQLLWVVLYVLLAVVVLTWIIYCYQSGTTVDPTASDAEKASHQAAVARWAFFAYVSIDAAAVWGGILLFFNCLLDIADLNFQRR